MSISMPGEVVGDSTPGTITATVAGDAHIVPGSNPHGVIELMEDGDKKSWTWKSWKPSVLEAIGRGSLFKGSRWEFECVLKRGEKTVFRNIEGIIRSAEDIAAPIETVKAFIAGPVKGDDWTDKERATNRRTALMQAVTWASLNLGAEYEQPVLDIADLYFEWLEQTNGSEGRAEAHPSTVAAAKYPPVIPPATPDDLPF